MYRYIAAAHFHDPWTGEVSVTADEVVEPADDAPVRTGLFDQHGNPLYRVRDKLPFGFVMTKPAM